MANQASSGPCLSILLPVYNGERYLSEAIQSILNQTWKDFELIVLDDGSTDQTPRILEGLCALDARLVVHHQQHAGYVQALDKGIGLAGGKYIARMDADDISLPERFDKQLHFMELHPNCSVLATRIAMIDSSGQPAGSWAADVQCVTSGSIRGKLRQANCIAHPSIMMRADIAKRYMYIDDHLGMEDYELWLRLTSDGHVIEKLDEVLLLYRVHSGSVSWIANHATGEAVRLIRLRVAFLRRKLFARRLNRFDCDVFLYLLLDTAGFFFRRLRQLQPPQFCMCRVRSGMIRRREFLSDFGCDAIAFFRRACRRLQLLHPKKKRCE